MKTSPEHKQGQGAGCPAKTSELEQQVADAQIDKQNDRNVSADAPGRAPKTNKTSGSGIDLVDTGKAGK